jgi:hypothetical protein
MLTHNVSNVGILALTKEMQVAQIATPTNPAALTSSIYAKSNDRLHILSSGGIEAALVGATTEEVLTDAANIAWNVRYANAVVTITDNRILDNPTGIAPGYYTLRVIQDPTGSRLLTYGASFKFSGGTAPTLTTTPNAVDILYFYCDGTDMILLNAVLDVQ